MRLRRLGMWCMACAIAWGLMFSPGQANEGDWVRVALFVDTGKYYRNTIPVVTLNSSAGIQVKGKAANSSLYRAEGETAIRTSADGPYLLIKQTTDQGEAFRITQQLSKKGIQSEILAVGNAVQVVTGPYLDSTSLQSQKKLIEQEIGFIPLIKGTQRWDAGPYPDLSAAQAKADEIAAKGFEAHVAIVIGNKPEYRVWIGNESSQDHLSKLKDQLLKGIPGLQLQGPSQQAEYLLVKNSLYAPGTIPHFYLSPSMVIDVESLDASGLTVLEKENRKYRGKMELSIYKNAFTVVNELPLEQYLYSVVGSEMGTAGWPLEALKAQAILARTRVIGGGVKYGIAHLSDSTFDQAYYGISKESQDTRRAVDETAGLIVKYNGKPIESLYYSNAGGRTADGTEVWGSVLPYIAPVESEDHSPELEAMKWYLASNSAGETGYIRSDLVTLGQERNPAGFYYGTVNTDNVNFRTGPSTAYHAVKGLLPAGAKLVILQEVPEDNAYSWMRGPYTAAEVQAMLKSSSPVTHLAVSRRGPSSRVTEVKANGQVVAVPYPDAYRSLFNPSNAPLRSTMFDIVDMSEFAILAAGGGKAENNQGNLYAVQGNGSVMASSQKELIVLGADNKSNILSKEPQFKFVGKGFGHGMGLSQFGAKSLALKGYDFNQILSHYYKDVRIEKF